MRYRTTVVFGGYHPIGYMYVASEVTECVRNTEDTRQWHRRDSEYRYCTVLYTQPYGYIVEIHPPARISYKSP